MRHVHAKPTLLSKLSIMMGQMTPPMLDPATVQATAGGLFFFHQRIVAVMGAPKLMDMAMPWMMACASITCQNCVVRLIIIQLNTKSTEKVRSSGLGPNWSSSGPPMRFEASRIACCTLPHHDAVDSETPYLSTYTEAHTPNELRKPNETHRQRKPPSTVR